MQPSVRPRSGRGARVSAFRAPVAAEQLLEGAAEVVIEDGVEDGVHGRVGVAEPEEEGVDAAVDRDVGDPGADHVDDEEADPAAAEEGDDDGHADGGAHLPLVDALFGELAVALLLPLLVAERVDVLERRSETLTPVHSGRGVRRRVVPHSHAVPRWHR